MKIVSWNLENFARYAAPGLLPTIHEALGSPEVLCVQEVRVRPGDEARVEELRSALPGYACAFSLARDPKNVTFRGGRMYGVVTYVKESLALEGGLRAYVPAWDLEGRVVVTELSRRGLAIVNVYAVNGTSKPYFDHERGDFSGDRHVWKRRFVERLRDECLELRARGLELVLVGDWNVSRTGMDTHPRLRTEEPHAMARAAFNDMFMPALDVVDAFRELHPDAKKYTWFNARARTLDAARVDFALVSRSLVARVMEAEIDERVEARAGSDHAPLWITLVE